MPPGPLPLRFDRFRAADTEPFLALADDEGWICDRWEFDFLLPAFPAGCLTAREGETTVGYVTAIAYGRSGWIGNLLVPPGHRGRGIGAGLMELSLDALAAAGAATVWLTASAAGRPIYERLGFTAVDTVRRWVGTGSTGTAPLPPPPTPDRITAADAAGWGEARLSLLQVTADRGELTGDGDCFLVSQPCGDGRQVGPWGGTDPAAAARLLAAARQRAGAGTRMFLDVPEGNGAAGELLASHGFAVMGATLLMRRGPDPGYRPGAVFALGSMGSMG